MPSTFIGIEIGKRSLMSHSLGLNTIGHNMSNASAEGYSRQRVEMRATDPIYMPGLNREARPGQLGQGVDVQRIERVRDMLLEGRIISEANGEGYWSARDKYILALEQVYNEPGDLSIRALLDRFWSSWQELSLRPTEMGARKAVISRGQALIDAIHGHYGRLKEIRDMLEGDILATVARVNSYSSEISGLNEQITKIKAMGDNPNDLLDRRDLLVNNLSGILEITISTQDPDEYLIHTGGMHLVQGKHWERLDTVPDPDNDSYSNVIWDTLKDELGSTRGKLAALLELRDYDARQEIQNIDLMTVNFIDLVNEIHHESFGLNERSGLDFFVEYPFINNLAGNYDRNGDGEYDSSYLFRFTAANVLEPKDQIGLRGTLSLAGGEGTVAVEYYPTDTVEDVIQRINHSGAELVARLNQSGKLTLIGIPSEDPRNPDFVIRHIEDNNQFLVGYAGLLDGVGEEGAFDWGAPDAVLSVSEQVQFAVAPLTHPAGWIQVNPALIKDPSSVVSASTERAIGDGSAALSIARLRTQPIMLGRTSSFDEFFSVLVTEIGLKGEFAERALETEQLVLRELKNMRESLSGVNMDEEMANMIKYQHGYSAAARFITEFDRMIDTIINRMGV